MDWGADGGWGMFPVILASAHPLVGYELDGRMQCPASVVTSFFAQARRPQPRESDMPIDPVIVAETDYEKWGNLIKTWATGDNRLGDGYSYPLPQSLDELKAQLTQAGINMTIPPRSKAVQFVQYNLEVLALKLPPKEMILDSEQKLDGGAPYPLPAFYNDIFNGAAPNIPQPVKRKVNAQRIGDYTIRACA